MKSDSIKRAEMPSGTFSVLDERTLKLSNANLLYALKAGNKVLDAGCGSGAITKGISEFVDKGTVLGVDRSQELIDLAVSKFDKTDNLSFICSDILDYHTEEKYDLITTARTLQWIAEPAKVIEKMLSLLHNDGILCVLDYNHTLIEWDPLPPASMLHFYDRFLQWRADAGMDNRIGDHMPGLLESLGMKIILFDDYSEYSERGMPGFDKHIDIWNQVVRLRGKQLVQEGWITEEDRLQVIDDYAVWCGVDAKSMKLCLKATHAVNPNTERH